MALLQDLIQQIDDSALKERILHETNKLLKQKKFGLVFEEHLPECTPLYDVPIRVGSKVALKTGYVSDIYTVMNIDDNEVQCDRRETHEQKTFRLDELVTVTFGIRLLRRTITMRCSCWSTCMRKRWIASTSIRHTTPAQKTGSTITIMLTVLMHTVTVSGFL